jgi:predicted ArsR family transcriptional regulator
MALTDHELELVRRVALSTLPSDRKAVLDLFQTHLEGVTASLCAEGLKKSDDRARSLLNELVRVGLVITAEGAAPQGRPATRYLLAPQFADIVIREDKPVDHLLDLSLGSLF